MHIYFKEVQRFNQWWIWLTLILINLIPIWGIIQQVILKKPFGNNPMPDIGLYIFLFITLIFPVLFLWIQLKTNIDNNSIRFQFVPLPEKEIEWREVAKVEFIDYGFVGGWGIRMGTKYGTVYNIRGKKGLSIILKNGKKLVVGTQKESEMKIVAEKLNERLDQLQNSRI